MCEFVSWIEYQDKPWFLTNADLRTKEGRELRKHLESWFQQNVCGHGAIRHYWGIPQEKGENMEYPYDHMPAVIIDAMESGAMSLIGFSNRMLSDAGNRAHEEAMSAINGAYKNTKDAARKTHDKASRSLTKTYRAAIDASVDEDAKYTVCKAYNEATISISRAYHDTTDPLREAHHEIARKAFWDLFNDPLNRIEELR